MAKKTKDVLKNDITTVIADGGELTAAELRTILDDTVDSSNFDELTSSNTSRTATTGLSGTNVEAALIELQELPDTTLRKTEFRDTDLHITAATVANYQPRGYIEFTHGSGDVQLNIDPGVFNIGDELTIVSFPQNPTGDPGFTLRQNATTNFPFDGGGRINNEGDIRFPKRTSLTMKYVSLNQWRILEEAVISESDAPLKVIDDDQLLTPSEKRAVSEIAESDVAASAVSEARYASSTVANTPGTFSSTRTRNPSISSTINVYIYIELPNDFEVTDDIRLLRINNAGIPVGDEALSSLTKTAGNTGFTRYSSSGTRRLGPAQGFLVQRRASNLYTLSDKYRVPASIVTGGGSGAAGPKGDKGDPGDPGAQGSYTVRLYRRSTSTVVRPTLLTWTASTGVLSGSHAVDWETTIPTGDDPLWETNAVFDPSGSATTITAWNEPFRLTGPQGTAGTDASLDPSQTSKLAAIAKSTVYDRISGYQIASGSTTTVRDDAFMDRLGPIVGIDYSTTLYAQIPDTATVDANARVRHFSSTGSLKADYALSSFTQISGGAAGTVRYRGPRINLVVGDQVGVEVIRDRFTMNDQYRIPASGVTGLIQGTKGDKGERGEKGDPGSQGSYDVRIYLRASSEPTLPSGLTWTPSGGLSTNTPGWQTTVPSGSGELWEAISTFDPANDTSITTWSRAFQAGGMGPAGPMGPKGEKGDKGDTGPAGSGADLDASASRKLADITEVATRSYADAPGGTLAPSDGSLPPAPVGAFATPYVATSALTDKIFFEVTTGESLSNAVIRVFNSSNVAIGDPVDVSGAEQQATAGSGKTRYLTTQTVSIPAGGRIRVQNETVTPTSFTLSSKYRVPSEGVTRTATAPVGDTVEKALVWLHQQNSALSAFLRNALANMTIAATGVTTVVKNGVNEANAQLALEALHTEIDALSIPADAEELSIDTIDNLTATNVQDALEELQGDIDASSGGSTFFDHVGFEGTLTNLSTASDFYYIVSSSLPRTTLSSWTHVTNSVFPQPALASVTNYVVLLPQGKYPNKITWDRDSTQPEPAAGGPDIATVNQSDLQRLSGATVPDGYNAWRFRMPPWNNASSLRTGARIQIGDLLDTSINRIDLDPTIKVTDNNLDLSGSITALSELQQEKLQGLQLKTFSSDITTEGKPSADYDVLMATAWPDPDVTYARGVAFASQQARYTGIVPNGRATGYHDFFNLVSNTSVTLGKPTPEISSATSLSYLTASDGPASCSGIFRGTIQASDRTTNSRMRIDDDEGLFAAMTLHTPANLPNGTYPIMNIGNTNITGTKTLILQNDGPQYHASGLSLRVREQTGNPTSTTAIQDVPEPLYDATTGNDVTLFHPPVNTTPITVPHDWVVPASYTITSAAPVTYRLSVRVWNNGNDLGEHDFTSSLPDAMQKMANFTTAVPATTFTIPFGRVGFTGLGDETMRFTYTPVDTTSDNRRIIELALVGISNPAFTYAVRLTAVVKRSVTTPAGPTRDIVLSTIPAGNTHEVGFYARSRDRGTNPRTMIYHVSVDGVDGTNGDDGGASAPPTGSVPITFGPGTVRGNSIAVNRLMIVKPKKVLTPTDMNNFTTPSLRNRVDVGGLVRHAGGTFHEVFSPAYKSVILTNSKLQQLRHGSATNNTATQAAAAINFAGEPTPANITWSGSATPDEFSLNTLGDEITANTNFTGQLSLSVGVSLSTTDIAAAGTNSKSFLLLIGKIQEKIGTADWKDVPGPELSNEIRIQLAQGRTERPEVTSSQPYALIRREFSTVANFKAGAKYRISALGYRLHANSSGEEWATNRNWSGNVSTVVLRAGQTFMTMNITPSI